MGVCHSDECEWMDVRWDGWRCGQTHRQSLPDTTFLWCWCVGSQLWQSSPACPCRPPVSSPLSQSVSQPHTLPPSRQAPMDHSVITITARSSSPWLGGPIVHTHSRLCGTLFFIHTCTAAPLLSSLLRRPLQSAAPLLTALALSLGLLVLLAVEPGCRLPAAVPHRLGSW